MSMDEFIVNLIGDEAPQEEALEEEEMLVLDIAEEEAEQDNNHWDAIHKVYNWFTIDEDAHQSYTDEMEEAYKLWTGRHWDLKGYNGNPLRNEEVKRSRPNSVENITFSLVEGFVSEFAQEMDIVDFPVDENDDDVATVMTDLKKFIATKNHIKNEKPKFLRWFFLYGTGIWHTYWDDNWAGGRGPNRWKGDIRWRALHPNMFFPDARCRESVDDGIRVHKAIWKPIEHVKERYPGADILADTVDPSDFIGDEVEGGTSDELTDQVRVIETWYIGEPLITTGHEENEGNGLHIIWWLEGQNLYLDHANYINHDPGETPTFSSAFVVKQCYPREGSIFGYGEPHFFKEVQINRNKTAEIIMEGHVHQSVGQTFYSEGSLSASQEKVIKQYGTVPGMWFKVLDINGIRREFGANIPPSLFQEADRLQNVAENIAGRFDISQGRTPGSVTAFRALDLLNTRAQVRLRSKEEAIASGYEEVGMNINRLIDRNYDTVRSYRIIGENDDRRWGRYDPDDTKKAYLFDTNDTMPLKQFTETFPSAGEEGQYPQEGQDFEIYAPELDVTCKVSTTLPSDRLFYMEMAKELLAGQLIDEETFWYVMEHGKFPPFEEIREKIEEKKIMEEQMQQQMMMMQMMGQGNQQMPPQEQYQGNQQMPIPQQNAPQVGQMQGQGQLPQLAQQNALQPNIDDIVAQAQSIPEPTADDVIEMLPDEAKKWYAIQQPEIQQAFIEEIKVAMKGGEQQQS